MRKSQRKQRGMTLLAMLMGLLFLVAILLLSSIHGGYHGDIGAASRNTLLTGKRRAENYVAQNLAETGIRMSMEWLARQGTPPNATAAFAPSAISSFYGATTVSGWSVLTLPQGPTSAEDASLGQTTGTIRVHFLPYASNTTSNRKMFVIESKGEFQGQSYIVRVHIRQHSFARYAYFSNRASSGWWVSMVTRFQGPVHINGVDASGTALDPTARINILWRLDYAKNDTLIFTYPGEDYFTTSLPYSQLNWWYIGGYYYDPEWWSDYWNWITAAGVKPVTDAPIITMPTASTDQKSAALGTLAEPTLGTFGASIPNNGSATTAGIYIAGDVLDFNLNATGTGSTTQVMEIRQNDGTQDLKSTITLNRSTDQTTLVLSTSPTGANTWTAISTATYSGTTNGVIYVNGNIGEQGGARRGGLSGVIANSVVSGGVVTTASNLTIVTEASKAVNLNGGLVYANLISDSSNPCNIFSSAAAANTTSGTLGLVSGKFQIVDNDDGGSPITNISVHAVVMAYNTFNVTNPTTRAVGQFNLLGGYIVNTNGQFGLASADGTVQSGFTVNRNYDQRVAENPPPFYPTTDKGYRILSFQRVTSPL